MYDNREPLYTYNMEVPPSKVVAVLGESGSGKSTMLDIIAGFIEPLHGSVTLDGKELLGMSVEARPVTILFQHHNLFEHLNVQKNVLLGVSKRLKESREEAAKVQAILKEVGLEGYAQRVASQLSGGQQQRVALARVLMRREPILLLDEPFSGLDDATRIEMLSLVQKITQTYALYTVMVTHDRDDCDRIADRVYKMQEHTLIQQ